MIAFALLSVPVAARAGEEAPLDAPVVRSLRERLAAGSVRQAMAALSEMAEAPHSRHGLLLQEAIVRAELRVAGADQRLPQLEAERARADADLVAARASTSTSAVKRLEERIAALDRDHAALAAQRQIEARLREVCLEGWRKLAPRLSPASADELAALFLVRLAEERRPFARAILVEMAGAVPSAAVTPALMELATSRAEPPEIVATALAALGRRGESGATPAAVAALSHADWRVQSEAVEALRLMHRRSSIPFLIARLEQAQGRLRDDLGFALRSLTGERFVADPATWRDWWQRRQGDFTMPDRPAERLVVPEEGEGGTRFFGIGSFSQRVVFVLDVSGSMAEPMRTGTDAATRRSKLDVARSHLKSALAGLASDAHFDVLLYAERVEACFPRLQRADDANRQAALRFVETQQPRSGTNIHGALLAALELGDADAASRTGASSASRRPPDVDTIFFLTDGYATSGLVRTPGLILNEIASRNRTRRVRIHTVGVGDHDRAFLQALAAQTGGTYVAR